MAPPARPPLATTRVRPCGGDPRPTAGALLLAAALLACEPPPSPPEIQTPDEAAASISNAGLRRVVGALAHDSMRGRQTPSPELLKAAAYVESRFRRSGLQPGAGVSYLQRFPFSFGTEGVNVIGRLQGSDRDLRPQLVLVAAHLDHLGVGIPEGRDSVYNGADDNASGVAALLELAGAFGRLRPAPRRSLVFAAFGGEEHGLWGSRYFVDHPTLPLERVVAVVNMDMIGRNFRDTIVAMHSEFSDLGLLARQVAAARPELSLRVVGDLWPEEKLFARSDHFPFARRAVPALFLTSGLHVDYHRPSDEVTRLDFEKMTRVARLVFFIVLEIAERDDPPQ